MGALSFALIAHAKEAPVIEEVVTTPEVALTPKEYAEKLVTEKWGKDEWYYFDKIIVQESRNWTVYTAHYPTGYTIDGVRSSAHGLGGFLDGTWNGVGCVKTDDPLEQVRCTIKYVEQRYGTPSIAWRFHLAHNWY